MASTPMSPMIFQVVNSGALKLFGRALPYRPLTIGGRQRATFTWYPGSPAAIVQMLGPEEQPIQMTGFWKERFLGALPTVVLYGGTPIYSVALLVETVDELRRTGRKIKLTWDRLVRFGHITEFTQTWHTPFDCEWSLEFSVAAQEEASEPVIKRPPINPASLALAIDQLAQDIADTLDIDPTFGVTDQLLAIKSSTQGLITTISGSVGNLATKTVDRIATPLSVARDTSATLAEAVRGLGVTISSIEDRALSEIAAFPGGQNAVPVGAQISGVSYTREWSAAMKQLRTYSAQQRFEVEREAQKELLASFVATAKTDYRDVSMRYYGTQDSWRDLMLFNEARISEIPAGTLVWVPLRTDRPAGYGPAGTAGKPQ